jgi:cytochrome c oxidase subunit 2
LGTSAVLLGGCSSDNEWGRFAMPAPGSEQGEHILSLWQGAWIAALVTGIVVWGLIFWAIWNFRRRSADEIPVQTRYNLPLEIFYTIAPVLMVIVFFAHTVNTQNAVLDDDIEVDHTIEVVGFQWSWVFNHGVGERNGEADEDASDEEFAYDSYVYEAGTAAYIPTLVLPVGETTRFNLHSPDVIHDFGVPGFLMKMDVIPGRVNHYAITPTEIGSYKGKCYELCGVSHSRMLFNVEVVSPEDYDAYLAELEADGRTSETPLLGGADARTQSGLDSDHEGDAE